MRIPIHHRRPTAHGRNNSPTWTRAFHTDATWLGKGFTLVEVILSLAITIGLLLVAVGFYQHATHLRSQLLAETERLSTIRLLMDRITTDLRGAHPNHPRGFAGDPASIEFVRATAPGPESWLTARAGTTNSTPLSSNLRWISCSLASRIEETNVVVRGVHYSAELLSAAHASSASTTNAPVEIDEEEFAEIFHPPIEAVRHLHFRYWDGRSWRENWNAVFPPAGVEITIGTDPLEPDRATNEYTGELFRRVVQIPTGAEQASRLEGFGDRPPL